MAKKKSEIVEKIKAALAGGKRLDAYALAYEVHPEICKAQGHFGVLDSVQNVATKMVREGTAGREKDGSTRSRRYVYFLVEA